VQRHQVVRQTVFLAGKPLYVCQKQLMDGLAVLFASLILVNGASIGGIANVFFGIGEVRFVSCNNVERKGTFSGTQFIALSPGKGV